MRSRRLRKSSTRDERASGALAVLTKHRADDQASRNDGKLLEEVAVAIVYTRRGNSLGDPKQSKNKKDGGEQHGSGTRGSTPLNREASKEFNRGSKVDEGFAMGSTSEDLGLLPRTREVVPDERDDAEADRGNSVD